METDVVVPDEGKHSMPGLPRQLAIPTKDVGSKTPPGHTPGARRSLQHDQTFTPQLWFPLLLLSSPSVHMQVVGHLSTLKSRSSFELRHYRGSYSRGIRCISSSVCTELLLSPAGPSLESRLAAYRTSGVDDDERQSCPFLFFSFLPPIGGRRASLQGSGFLSPRGGGFSHTSRTPASCQEERR